MPDPQLLNRGSVTGQSVTTGATYYMQGPSGTNIVHCEGESELTVQVQMTGGAAGDLTVTVEPYQLDGATVMPFPIVAVPAATATFSGGKVYYAANYDVSNYDAVRISLKNNNVATQTIDRASWRLS